MEEDRETSSSNSVSFFSDLETVFQGETRQDNVVKASSDSICHDSEHCNGLRYLNLHWLATKEGYSAGHLGATNIYQGSPLSEK